MARGILKYWNADRGFGFIQSEQKGAPDVFLYAGTLPRGMKSPRLGDVIVYTLGSGKNGKPRALEAAIEGESLRVQSTAISRKFPIPLVSLVANSNITARSYSLSPQVFLKNRIPHLRETLVCMVIVYGAIIFMEGLTHLMALRSSDQSDQSVPSVSESRYLTSNGSSPPFESSGEQVIQESQGLNCQIKGNISHDSGRRYYHLPDTRYYGVTIIDESRGERWFCTEQEAIEAGWTRVPN